MKTLLKEKEEVRNVSQADPQPDYSVAFAVYKARMHSLKSWEFQAFLSMQEAWLQHRGDPKEQQLIEIALEEIFVPKALEMKVIPPGPHRRLEGERLSLAKFIGDKMKCQREAKGMTQEQLAQRSGLGQSHICRLENGEHTPTRATLEKIAAALEIPAREFDPLEQ